MRFYFNLCLVLFLLSFILLPSSKSVNNFYYVFLLFPCFLSLMAGKVLILRKGLLFYFWVLFFLILIGRASIGAEFSFYKNILYVFGFFIIIITWADINFFKKPVVPRCMFWMLVFYIFTSTIYYWFKGYLGFGERFLEMPSRLSGPILSSAVLVSVMTLMFSYKENRENIVEIVLAVFLSVFLVGFVLQSRTGLVGLLALFGLTFLGLFSKQKTGAKIVFVSSVCLLAFLLYYFLGGEPFLTRLVERGDAGRLELWELFYRAWMNCGFWLGCGVNEASDVILASGQSIQHPHNIVINMGFYYGAVVLIAFAVVLVQVLYQSYRQKNPWGCYLLVSLLMLNFDGGALLNSPDEIWLLLLFPMFLITAQDIKEREAKCLEL